MPADGLSIVNQNFLIYAAKIAVLIILVFYAIFALIIIRQVNLMRKTLITAPSALIRDFSIYHFLFSLVLIFLVWKFL